MISKGPFPQSLLLRFVFTITCFFLLTRCGNSGAKSEFAAEDWRVYQGDKSSSQYSTLRQINRENVSRLQVAWTFNSGDLGTDDRTQIQCNPLIIDGVIYATSPKLKLLAIDGATGVEKWRFDPFAGEERHLQGVNRGLVYWENDHGAEARILFTASHFLYAIDPSTGKQIDSFGENGAVNMKDSFAKDLTNLSLDVTTPGAVYKNTLILGSRVSEGKESAPGDVRAYHVLSGKLEWVFHTIPHPGEFGYDSWPADAWERYTVGGANSWSGISIDEQRGIAFVPTGSPAFDFYGGNRDGDNLFGNCLIALNAETGERIWHYQFVRHDIWDRDLPATPILLTVNHAGKQVDAVAQVTKHSFIFLFNRETGEPLFPIEERKVPPSDLYRERTSPTQPFPLKPPPFARQIFSEDEVTDLSPASHDAVLTKLRTLRSGDQFVPPSLEGTIILPGLDGGAEWGGQAIDPHAGILYVNSNEMAWILQMVDLRGQGEEMTVYPGKNTYMALCSSCHGVDKMGDGTNKYPPLLALKEKYGRSGISDILANGRGEMPAWPGIAGQQKEELIDFLFDIKSKQAKRIAAVETDQEASEEYPYAFAGYIRFLDPDGYPALKPPWGTLNAIDLNQGEIRWTVRLGEREELTARGIPKTGTENYGGPILTAGGLIFIGSTNDEKFRAFDKDNGEMLWETPLPAGGYATPSTYLVNGRQYVVIACGGGKMGTKSGDAYVAFALPE